MWVQLSSWVVQDDGIDLAVGDLWTTQLAVSLERAEELEDSAILGFQLLNEPRSIEGPRYHVVARVTEDEDFGTILDVGQVPMNPTAFTAWSDGAVLKVESQIVAGQFLDARSEHPAWREWRVSQIHLRQWDVVADADPNSYRPDPATVRFREIERIQMWEDEKDRTTGQRIFSDYLLHVA
jgi:hypothetical protein